MDPNLIRRLTTTSVFLLPLVGMVPDHFLFQHPRYGTKSRFFNTYLFDSQVPKYQKNHISVVYHSYQDINFNKFEKIVETNHNFVDSYDLMGTKHSVIVFKIPEVYQDSYQFFLRGQYSKFGEIAQAVVMAYSPLRNPEALKAVFDKSPKLREVKNRQMGIELDENAELWSIYEEKLDILTPTIKNYLLSTKLTPNLEFNEAKP
jgi:hypothetical protein